MNYTTHGEPSASDFPQLPDDEDVTQLESDEQVDDFNRRLHELATG